MRNTLLSTFILISLFSFSANAQMLMPEVVASSGGYIVAPNGSSLSWTLGEVISETFRSPGLNRILTQGFHQPEKLTISGIPFTDVSIVDAMVIYPNPSTGQLNIQLQDPPSDNLELTLFDVLGRALFSRDLGYPSQSTNQYQLDLGSLAAAVYIIRVQSEDGQWTATGRIRKID